MLLHSLSLLVTTAALLPLGNCMLTPDDIPAEWKTSVEQAWDYTQIRSVSQTPDEILTEYPNWMLDQIMDGNGTVNVCMRWGSNKTLTEETRRHVEAVHVKNYAAWLEHLPGYDNFPYNDLRFNVIGWAVQDKNLVAGSTEGFDIHTGYKADDGFPTCNPACSRHLHPDGDFSGCDGGADKRYHHFFFIDPSWGKDVMAAATGYGFYVSEYGWETIGSKVENWPLLLHETGHTFGFPDYLDNGKNHSMCSTLWLPLNHPAEFVMKPGDQGAHVPEVTEMEVWMLRYMWTRFSRLRGWQKDDRTFGPYPVCESFDG